MNNQIAANSEAIAATGTEECYDRLTIRLHWVTVGIVALLWIVAEVIDLFPKGEPRVMVRSVHILLGVTLAFILLIRIVWRINGGKKLPRAIPRLAGIVANLVHYGLYLLLLVTVVLGITNVWMRGDSLFGLFSVPRYASVDNSLRHWVQGLHGDFANILLIAAGLHALAALVHHYVLHDAVLCRMLPRLRRSLLQRP